MRKWKKIWYEMIVIINLWNLMCIIKCMSDSKLYVLWNFVKNVNNLVSLLYLWLIYWFDKIYILEKIKKYIKFGRWGEYYIFCVFKLLNY